MNNITNKRSHKNLWAALHAGVLLVITYLTWNIPMDLDDSGFWLKMVSTFKTAIAEPDTLPSDLLLINTCYDHTFIPVYSQTDKRTIIGQRSITDRRKLLTLLQALAHENNYRYVVCDIRFDNPQTNRTDSALFDLLSRMPRCCVPFSSSMESFPSKLSTVAATSEYSTNILNSDFLKYQYLSDSGESIALRMAGETDSINITRWGCLYRIGWKLCINSHIVDIETNVSNEISPNFTKNILHLGSDMLPIIEAGVENMFKDKIVMIGDCFEEDMHNTVSGKVSGLMIIYNAYKALVAKRNIPGLWVWFFIFTVYYLLTLATLYHFEPHDLLRMLWLSDKPVLTFLFDWMGFKIFFTVIALTVYFMADLYIDSWICSSYFTAFGKIYLYIVSQNKHK